MAPSRVRAQKPVGSSEWIVAEKENLMELVDQEMEDIVYPTRHEMEWLNEHMAEIFSGKNFNVTEIFKTPGKLRGKTPRTLRKRDNNITTEARVPLSDIFSSEQNIRNSPAPLNRFDHELAKCVVADPDKTNVEKDVPLSDAQKRNQNSNPRYNTDSGYHGLPDEYSTKDVLEDDIDLVEIATPPQLDESTIVPRDRHELSPSVDRRTTDCSFHSAREVKEPTVEPMALENMINPPYTVPVEQQSEEADKATLDPSAEDIGGGIDTSSKGAAHAEDLPLSKAEDQTEHIAEHDVLLDHNFDDIGSPSDGSTPDRPLVRKSSLSFASLPAREPLKTKRSMGGPVPATMSRVSHIGRQTGGARMTQVMQDENAESVDIAHHRLTTVKLVPLSAGKPPANEPDTNAVDKSLHNKSSTQLLHEKINMLGQPQPNRSTKSITPAAMSSAPPVSYPSLPISTAAFAENDASTNHQSTNSTATQRDGEVMMDLVKPEPASLEPTKEETKHRTDAIDALIKGTVDRTSGVQYIDPAIMDSPGPKLPDTNGLPQNDRVPQLPVSERPESPPSQRYPDLAGFNQKLESPTRYDGPLSASKSRLQSIMKTAKGLFTSSAGISAVAKLEALSQSPTITRSQTNLSSSVNNEISNGSQRSLPASPTRQGSRKTLNSSVVDWKEERKKEKEFKHTKQMDELLEQAREQEKQKAAQFKAKHEPLAHPLAFQKLDKILPPDPPVTRSSPRKAAQSQALQQNPPPPLPQEEGEPKFTAPALPRQQPKRPAAARRPVKPTRETQKSKPQPVSIRVGTLSQRIPLSGAAASVASATTVQDGNQRQNPPATSRQQHAVTKKPSNSSLQPTLASTSTMKPSTASSNSNLKPKPPSAAERRREKEQLEMQRKMEQQQRSKETEHVFEDDPKKLAQKQEIERRRLENAARKQQRQHQTNQHALASNDSSIISQQGRPTVQHAPQRIDPGPSRPPSRMNSMQPSGRLVNQPLSNPAKPPKRPLEQEENPRPKAGKGSGAEPVVKRRKTEDDDELAAEPANRPTMAPPIRQSNIRKPDPVKSQVYLHGNSMAPPQAVSSYQHQNRPSQVPRQFQHAPPIQPQRAAGHHAVEMAKFASGKIPFADAPNPAATNNSSKTPGTKAHQKTASHLRSSPAYPNGENIKLPEIPTDSEDEDSENEPYNVPEWAKPENLAGILADQEGQDGEMVFGPSAPLHLEEIFKDNKDRARKFRDRTSSANWAGPDGLTQEEIRWDLEQRERLKRNGGWTFTTS